MVPAQISLLQALESSSERDLWSKSERFCQKSPWTHFWTVSVNLIDVGPFSLGGGTTSNAQKLHLDLHSGITPGGTGGGSIYDAKD